MAPPEKTPVLEARGLVRRYPERGAGARGAARETVAAAGVSLTLLSGEVLGLLGRSGAGKSTVARLLLGLETPDAGEVLFLGRALASLDREWQRRFRRAVQVVFQDPHGSLDPRQSLGSIVSEPVVVHRLATGEELRERGKELLADVGLPGTEAFARRRPRELSGGERQRVALARALACRPQALILDEPVSALDVSVRGQVLNLVMALRQQSGLALLLISHDVRLVGRVCTRVAVMANARIVEEGTPDEILASPRHPATSELLEASRWLASG